MVYLLHFDRPYKQAAHYLGYAKDLNRRLSEHRSGKGARLMEVLKGQGISWVLARTWEGDRSVERRLKNQHHSPRLCPICQAKVP